MKRKYSFNISGGIQGDDMESLWEFENQFEPTIRGEVEYDSENQLFMDFNYSSDELIPSYVPSARLIGPNKQTAKQAAITLKNRRNRINKALAKSAQKKAKTPQPSPQPQPPPQPKNSSGKKKRSPNYNQPAPTPKGTQSPGKNQPQRALVAPLALGFENPQPQISARAIGPSIVGSPQQSAAPAVQVKRSMLSSLASSIIPTSVTNWLSQPQPVQQQQPVQQLGVHNSLWGLPTMNLTDVRDFDFQSPKSIMEVLPEQRRPSRTNGNRLSIQSLYKLSDSEVRSVNDWVTQAPSGRVMSPQNAATYITSIYSESMRKHGRLEPFKAFRALPPSFSNDDVKAFIRDRTGSGIVDSWRKLIGQNRSH